MKRFGLLAVLLMLLAMPGSPASTRTAGCQALSPPEDYLSLPSDTQVDWIQILRASSDSIEVRMGEFPHYAVWASRDSGGHWQRAKLRLPRGDVGYLVTASGASRSRVLYISRDNAGILLRSFDGGASWDRAGLRVAGVNQARARVEVVVNGIADNGRTLYGSVTLLKREPADNASADFWLRLPGIYVSKDYGDTWAAFSLDLVGGTPVAVNDLDPRMIFGVSAQGLVRSTDGGRTWQPVSGQKELATPIFLRGREAVLRYLKEHAITTNLNALRGYAVEIEQIEVVGKERAVLVTSNRGLFISHDLGSSWCRSEVGGKVMGALGGMAVSTSDPTNIFVTVVLRPTDLGSWHEAREPAALYFSRDAGLHFEVIYESPVGRTKRR